MGEEGELLVGDDGFIYRVFGERDVRMVEPKTLLE